MRRFERQAVTLDRLTALEIAGTRNVARISMISITARNVLHCPTCDSRRRLIALITDPPVVHRILRHLALPAEPLALAPPRSPPQLSLLY